LFFVASTINDDPLLFRPAAQHSLVPDTTTHEMEDIVPVAVPGSDSAVHVAPLLALVVL
jgi:hypothetical protein